MSRHLRAWLDRADWAYETSRIRAVDFDFSVRVMDQEVGRYFEDVWSHMAIAGQASHRYAVVERGASSSRRFAVYFDEERLITTTSPQQALGIVFWHINTQVVSTSRAYTCLHAGAVEHRGRAILLPAPPDAGKTTTVAALTLAGLRYVTDETVVIDPASLTIHPYPKPLAIEEGSWEVLASLRPSVASSLDDYLPGKWHVSPTVIRHDAVAASCTPDLILAVKYEPGQPTRLEPMTPSEALVELVNNSFNFRADAPRNLETLAAVVRQCRCYRLTLSDLGAACDLVMGLLIDEDASTTTEGRR